MLNKNIKKYMLFVASTFCVVYLPFRAFCSGVPQKISDGKKPFKCSTFSQVKVTSENILTTFTPPLCMYYEGYFNTTESVMKNSPFVLQIGSDFEPCVSNFILKLFMNRYGVIVVKSGLIGTKLLEQMTYEINLDGDNSWKKEILPFNDCGEDKEKAFAKGYRLVFTNVKNNRKIIFNFEIGNTQCKKDIRYKKFYCFDTEISRYNQLLDYVLSLNPTSPNGLFPKHALKSEVQNLTVTEGINGISDRCFSFRDNGLVTINFLGEIESIGMLAFHRCKMLENVNFSRCVKHVGERAFKSCHSLEKIEFPNGLKSLGPKVFYDCFNLNRVVLPDSLESVYSDTFDFTSKYLKISYKGKDFCRKDFFEFFLKNGGKILNW